MHPAYLNDPRIAEAWKLPPMNNLRPVSVRDMLIRSGRLIPAKVQ